ncbi:MAG: UvrD-helicase domain-containing protein [Thermoanaerobaculaceae bacterium]
MREELETWDAQTREKAVTEFSRPLLVEAGAGTGKTSLLVARILSWSLGPGWERVDEGGGGDLGEVAGKVARGVVAITFTEKAAAEMASRLGESFAAISRGASVLSVPQTVAHNPLIRRRALAFLRVLDRFTICTIHAYCRRVLARYPLEAGLLPEFAVDAEGLGVAGAVEAALAHFLTQPPEELLPNWAQLAQEQIRPNQLRQIVASLIAAGATPEDLRPDLWQQEAQKLARKLDEIRRKLLSLWREVYSGQGRMQKAQELMAALAGLGEGAEWRGFLQDFRQAWRSCKLESKVQDWAKGKLTQAEEKAFGDQKEMLEALAKELGDLAKSALAYDEAFFAALMPVVRYVLAKAKTILEERGYLTFQDLLIKALNLFARNPEVCLKERRRMHQLLVDEFQDTDRWQAKLLEYLALSGEERPGLFVVGDPKQSIYAWRSADFAAYEAFARQILAAGGECLPLVRNFRSVPAILQEVHRLIAPVMRAEQGVQPAYQELIPHRQGDGFVASPHGNVEHWILWDFQNGQGAAPVKARKLREMEACALAAHIHELHHQHGVAYKDIAVLFRALSDVHIYLEAFHNLGIPTVTQRDRTYFQRREVLDAFCLLRAVAQPEDQLALVGFLRSPWAGVPDAAWLPLKEREFFTIVARLYGDDRDLLQQLRQLLRDVAQSLPLSLPGRRRIAGWETSALWALRVLGLARQSWDTDPPEVFLYRLRNWLQFEATEAARFPGRVRLEHLRRFFRLFVSYTELFQDRRKALAALERATREAWEMPLPPQPEAEDAVLLSSIHQVKGLDFAHVFLADTGRQSRDQLAEEVKVGWIPETGILVMKIGRWVTANWYQLRVWEEKVAKAELVRLLYVATTRARDRLVICQPWSEKGKLGGLSELLEKRQDRPNLVELTKTLSQGQDRLAAGGAIWVFPGTSPLANQGPIVPEETEFPWHDAQFQVRTVIKRQEWAQKYQARPLLAPASQEAHEKLHEHLREDSEGQRGSGQAMLAGSLVHRVLQLWNWNRPPEEELAHWQREVVHLAPGEEEPRVIAEAVSSARELLKRFASSPLFADFCQLGKKKVFRELPLLMRGGGEEAAEAYVGSVDLLYWADEGPVVVDFKTDRVAGSEMEKRVEVYEAQGRRYCQALQEAWGLGKLPAFELWFLWAGARRRLW